MSSEQKPSKERIELIIAHCLWAALLAYLLRPFIHGNQDAINVIVTVFSVMAGFVVAIITVLGDPKSLPSGSWRRAQLSSTRTYNRLVRQKLLFKCYLIALTLIFLSVLIKDTSPTLQLWIEYIYLFFSVLAFAASFYLPSALIALQQERIDYEIEERKEKERQEEGSKR